MCCYKCFFLKKKSHTEGVLFCFLFFKKRANKQTLEDAAEPPCSRNKTPGGCNSSGSATPDRSFQLSLLTAERFLGEKRQAEKRGGCGRSEDLILEILHSKGNPSALHLHLGDTQQAQSPSPPTRATPLAPRHTQVSWRDPPRARSRSLHWLLPAALLWGEGRDLHLRAPPRPLTSGQVRPARSPVSGRAALQLVQETTHPLGLRALGRARLPGPAPPPRRPGPALSPPAPRDHGPHPLLQLILRARVLWLVQVYVKHSCHVLSFPVSEVRRWVEAVPPPSSPHGPGLTADTTAAAAITGCLSSVRLRLGLRLAPQVQRESMRTRFCEADCGQCTCVQLSPGVRYWQTHAQKPSRSRSWKLDHAHCQLKHLINREHAYRV